jgi:hypothetical protein
MFNSETVVYAHDVKEFGKVVAIDFRTGKVTLDDGFDNEVETHINEITELVELGELEGFSVYDRDVLQDETGKLYELVFKDNMIEIHALDSRLERTEIVDIIRLQDLRDLEGELKLVDSVFTLKNQLPVVNFKMAVVKEYDTVAREIKYFYACNDETNEQVDLLPVGFLAGFEGEEYTRITLSHEVFLDSIDAKTLEYVAENEFNLYVAGMQSFADDEAVVDTDEFDATEEDEEEGFADGLEDEVERCEDCDEYLDECDCEDWA